MPELIEVELYRAAVHPLVGSAVSAVEIVDPNYLRPRGRAAEDFEQVVGMNVDNVRRHGKLMMIDLGQGEHATVLGMRFGMTGRLLVDGSGPIERLEYASDRNEESWDRFRIHIAGRVVTIRDPRRLGSVELEPDEGALGPDAQSIDGSVLALVLAGRTASIKGTLLNQKHIAGLGNLLVDEILWRASVAPRRESGALDSAEVNALASTIVQTVAELTERGGSHTGDTFEERHVGGHCPRDGSLLRRDRVASRGTWWCAEHQV